MSDQNSTASLPTGLGQPGEHSEKVKKMKERLESYRSLHIEVKSELEIVDGFAKAFSSLLTNTTKKVERLRDEHKNIVEAIDWLETNAESELHDIEPHLIDLKDDPIVKQSKTLPSSVLAIDALLVASRNENIDAERVKTFAEILQGSQNTQNDQEKGANVPTSSQGGDNVRKDSEPVPNPETLTVPKAPPPSKNVPIVGDSSSIKTKPVEGLARTAPPKSTNQKPAAPVIPSEHKRTVKPTSLETVVEEEVVKEFRPTEKASSTTPSIVRTETVHTEPAAGETRGKPHEHQKPDTKENAEKKTKKELRKMEEQQKKEKKEQKKAEKNARKEKDRLAEEARLKKEAVKREQFDMFVKIYCTAEVMKKYGPIPNFDELAAKKCLADRAHYHKQRNDPDLAMYCEILADNMSPMIVHEVFKFKTPGVSFTDSLKLEKRFFVLVKTVGTIYSVCGCKKTGDEEGAKEYIEKIISRYISVQKEIRIDGVEIPDELKRMKILKSILSEMKSENVKKSTWETSRTFFEQISPEDCNMGTLRLEFDLMLISEISKTNDPIFVQDGYILQKLVSEGTPKKVLIEQYIDLVAQEIL